MTTPRIYAACLASYSAGRLHGVWIDATQGVDHIDAEIRVMLSESFEPNAEEWAFHDYENMPPQGDYPDLEQIAKIAVFLEEGGPERWGYLALFGAEELDRFGERLLGEYGTRADMAELLLENTGGLADIPDHLTTYLDFDAYGRDLLTGGDVCEHDGYYFWRS